MSQHSQASPSVSSTDHCAIEKAGGSPGVGFESSCAPCDPASLLAYVPPIEDAQRYTEGLLSEEPPTDNFTDGLNGLSVASDLKRLGTFGEVICDSPASTCLGSMDDAGAELATHASRDAPVAFAKSTFGVLFTQGEAHDAQASPGVVPDSSDSPDVPTSGGA